MKALVPSASCLRYISLMKLTAKGLARMEESPSRRSVSEKRVADMGGRSLGFYATMGAYDFVQIFEMPNNMAMMQYVLSARRDGYVDPLVLPAFDTKDFDQILANLGDAVG